MTDEIRIETVAEYIARGGKVHREPPCLPSDLLYVPDSQQVDLLLGASFDDVFGNHVSRFNVSADIADAIAEEVADYQYDREYNE